MFDLHGLQKEIQESVRYWTRNERVNDPNEQLTGHSKFAALRLAGMRLA